MAYTFPKREDLNLPTPGSGLYGGISAPQISPFGGNYISNYQNQINKALSNINNYAPFKYDPNNDASYQTYVDQQERMGKRAYKNQLGMLSTATGGMPNSWAGSQASQAYNDYVQAAAQAMPQYEQAAYQQWQGGYSQLVDKFNTIMNLDNIAYGRYRDSINDRYQQQQMQIQQYNQALQQKQAEIQAAYDKTKLLGYVDNESAAILGVQPGTPSYEATQAAQQREDWLWQQQQQLAMDKQKMDYAHQQDIEMFKMKEAQAAKQANAESGGNSYGIKNAADARKLITKILNPEDKEYGVQYDNAPDYDKTSQLLTIINEVANDPTLGETKKEEILKYIYESTNAGEMIDKYYQAYR